MADDISRRKFVADVGLTTAGFAIVPRHVLGKGQTPPSDKLNVACVGAGGQGRSNMCSTDFDRKTARRRGVSAASASVCSSRASWSRRKMERFALRATVRTAAPRLP